MYRIDETPVRNVQSQYILPKINIYPHFSDHISVGYTITNSAVYFIHQKGVYITCDMYSASKNYLIAEKKTLTISIPDTCKKI